MPAVTTTIGNRPCQALVLPLQTWSTLNWTRTRWPCTGAAVGPPRADQTTARPPTTAPRPWSRRRHRRNPAATDPDRRLRRSAVVRTKRIRSVVFAATRRSDLTSTPSRVNPVKRSSEETRLKDSLVDTFDSAPSLGVYYCLSLTLSVCMSVCLSRCSFKLLLLFCFSVE